MIPTFDFETTAAEIIAHLERGDIAAATQVLRHNLDPEMDLTDAQSLHRFIKKQRFTSTGGSQFKLAILGNSTLTQLADLVELQLTADNMDPEVWVGDYGNLAQDTLNPDSALYSAKRDLVFIALNWRDIQHPPVLGQPAAAVAEMLQREVAHLSTLWETIHQRLGCQIIIDNFHHRPWRALSNHEAREGSSFSNYIDRLNHLIAERAPGYVTIHDANGLASYFGLRAWGDDRYYHLAKLPCAPQYLVPYAQSVASIIRAHRGLAKKCLILDLDNTLWGGVIGDDGITGIKVGQGDAESEAYFAFQNYVKELNQRGVVLAVCSKNDQTIAAEPFNRSGYMPLKHSDIACFIANWGDKATNIRMIAQQLSLGLDSMVFVDDNPAERALVRQFLPQVAVPELTADPADYIQAIHRHHYFQAVSLSGEDLARSESYKANIQRQQIQQSAGSMEAYLASLEMTAMIQPITEHNLERAVQLINKSNQFNLTTRRYQTAQVQSIAEDADWLTMTITLDDRFGQNGLISVLLAKSVGTDLYIDTWVMSCRVLKRGVEQTVANALVQRARARGAMTIRGKYIPTAKNALVADHYAQMAFARNPDETGDGSGWVLAVENYKPFQTAIQVKHNG